MTKDSNKTKFVHKDTQEEIDMNEMKAKVYEELLKSDFKVDKNNIPISYKDELYETTNRMEKRMIEEFPQRIKGYLYDKLVELGVKDDEIDFKLTELMQYFAPKIRELIEKAYGIKWVEFAQDIQDDMNSMNLDSEYPIHYETLEECSADYVKRKLNGDYSTMRNAWKDAVLRGVTYNHKKDGKVKLDSWKQLERAYERIKDLGKEEEYGLTE